MKIILAGGSGHVGQMLRRYWIEAQHEVVVLSRKTSPGVIAWDGKTLGPWVKQLDTADVVVNLAGRTVNCRYYAENLRQMMDSRVDSTRVIGEAIAQSSTPPKIWLQSSTATIYAHRFDAPNDEATGIIGGNEPEAPPKWNASIEVATTWEKTLEEAVTPKTRKVALRSSIILSPEAGSIYQVLRGLARVGLGGTLGSGKQYVSWIHGQDFCRALGFLIEHEDLAGPVNVCSPNPLPQKVFAKILRESIGQRIGLPATAWMIEIGTFAMQTESELVLKSRRVIPARLLEAGFKFDFPDWQSAAQDLAMAPPV